MREALLDAARSRLIKIDHISQDGDLIAEGVTDVMRAERTVKDWRRFMADRRDKFAALSIAFEERRPLGEVQAQIDELLGLVSPPQQRWTGQQLWKTYVDLGIARTKRRRNAGLPELLSVLRCELKLDGGGFRPYRDTVKLRLGEWLARQETAACDVHGGSAPLAGACRERGRHLGGRIGRRAGPARRVPGRRRLEQVQNGVRGRNADAE